MRELRRARAPAMADVSDPPTVIPPPKAPSYVESIVAGLLSILFCLGTTDATGALPETSSSQASAPPVRARAATPVAPGDETEAAAQVIQVSARAPARGAPRTGATSLPHNHPPRSPLSPNLPVVDPQQAGARAGPGAAGRPEL